MTLNQGISSRFKPASFSGGGQERMLASGKLRRNRVVRISFFS